MKKKEILYLLIGLILIFSSLYVFTAPAFIPQFDFSNTGQIGDTIGGITAPIINLFGSYLVYTSFKEQIKANDIQRETLNNEKIRYESEKYFQLQTSQFNDIKSTLNNLEFIVENKVYYEVDGTPKFLEPLIFKGLNALNEFTKRVNQRAYYQGEKYDQFGMVLNFEFLLLSLLELYQNVDRQMLFIDDKKYHLTNIKIYCESFIIPFGEKISNNKHFEEIDVKKIEQLTRKLKLEIEKFNFQMK